MGSRERERAREDANDGADDKWGERGGGEEGEEAESENKKHKKKKNSGRISFLVALLLFLLLQRKIVAVFSVREIMDGGKAAVSIPERMRVCVCTHPHQAFTRGSAHDCCCC